MNKYTKNLFLLSLFCLFSFPVFSQIVRMETVLGTVEIEMHPDAAPNTVANFMNYVNDGDYDNSIIHRSASFSAGTINIIQGGGYVVNNGILETIVTDPAIVNEFNLSNIRGTIAMAKGSDPDSATSQWYFNTEDNSEVLDNASNSGGFTVFGTVISGMDVVDSIASLQRWDLGGAFSDLPLIDYSGSGTVNDDLVLITNVYDSTFHINSGLNGAWYYPDTSGSGIMLEIYPESGTVFMAWFTYDLTEPAQDAVADIGNAGHRWFTGFGSIDHDTNSVLITLKSTSGGLFDSTQDVTNSTVGTVTITFEDCSNATVDYTLTDQELSSSFPIQRLLSDNIALCERLSPEVVTE